MKAQQILIPKKLRYLFVFLVLSSPVIGDFHQSIRAAASAQQSSQNSPSGVVLKRTTRAVVLDVVVTDKTGHSFPGLTKTEFTLLEDGQPQTIATFEAAGISHRIDDPQRTISALGSEFPQIILLIDEMNTSFKDLAYARYCMGKLLRKNRGQLQQSTALMALTNEGLRVLHGSTLDSNTLWAALDHHHPAIPWRLKGGVYGASERLNISLGALEKIAAAGEGSSIRRSVVWISPGLPILSSISITAESQANALSAIRKLSDELLHARVTVYTVDPRGVRESSALSTISSASPGTFNASYWEVLSQSNNSNFGDLALQRFAIETGGKSFWGHNSIDGEVASSISEGEAYYTFSYYPSNSLFDGKFRKIAVAMNRPELKSRTRDGYFAIPEAPPPTDEQLTDQIELALSNPLGYLGVPVTAKASVLPGEPQQIRVAITADRHSLTWNTLSNGGQQCQLIAVAATFSSASNEKPLKIQKEDFAYVLPAERMSALAEKPVIYTLSLPFEPGIAHMRILLRDKVSGRTGTVDLRGPFSQGATAARP